VVIKLQSEGKERRIYHDLWEQETNRLNEMRHPNIVRLCPFEDQQGQTVLLGEASNLPYHPKYFALEYVAGGSLKNYLQAQKNFPFGWRLELFYQIIITLKYMHTLNWAHCDLKPGNVLFRAPPTEYALPRVVLIDFGSVSPVNRLTYRVGTPCYAAPEMIYAIQRPDVRPDFVIPSRADVWSLGALLFEIIAGRPLVNEQDTERAHDSTIRGQFDSLTDVAPKTPRKLADLVIAMTAKEAGKRPSLAQVINALEQIRMPPFFPRAAA
jgi:serine/threonine protein kinase